MKNSIIGYQPRCRSPPAPICFPAKNRLEEYILKNYNDSDYALNKFSDGIVYRYGNQIITVTLADYLAENPDKKEQDFRELKAVSDAIYFKQDRDGNAQTKKNSPFDKLDETALCCVQSPEEIIADAIDAQEAAERRRQRLAMVKHALGKLTDTQRKRYLLYVVNGLSTWRIAEIEGRNQKTVYECLQVSEKKIKKILTSS